MSNSFNFSLHYCLVAYYNSIILMVKIIKRTKMEYEHFYIFSGIYLFMRNSVCPQGSTRISILFKAR